ncbi:MAG: type III pantothenate kinase [Verrucomicrobiota bacterium]
MKTLLVDNSNSRTKFALASPEGLTTWRETLPTLSLTADSIRALLPSDATHATICSVVPHKSKLLAETCQSAGLATHTISHQSKLPIQIDYPTPSQIGPDRLANAAALVPLAQSTIVIDFGTAVTFDVVSSTNNGTYLGGVIAPGLAALLDYLPSKTALLPQIELAEPPAAIGKSTEHAMQVGAVIGYRGLIREILAQLRLELPDTPLILATGGDASLLAAKLPEIQNVDPDLTLNGILKIARLNHP